MKPKVSVIISNRNDVAMLSVTVRSCIEELKPLGVGAGEIVICDNSDEHIYKLLPSALATGYEKERTLKVLRQDFPCLFTARETAARNASGDYIICLDSHMLVGRDMIFDLVNFMEEHKSDKTIGFAHAPISWAHQHERNSKHDRDLSNHELGPWGLISDEIKTITWKGMPWICRREWFLNREWGLGGYGALSQHRVSWGGGDMHIGTKPWLLGFKNWAVPTSPGIHIGPFPKIDRIPGKVHQTKVAKNDDGYRYRLYSKSGEYPHTFGFLVACYVLGGEPMMNRNKKMLAQRFGPFLDSEKWWNVAIELGKDERKWLLNRQIMSFEEFLEKKPWQQTTKSTNTGFQSAQTTDICAQNAGVC